MDLGEKILKIKDDVDLKELEKFGFVKCHNRWEDYTYGEPNDYDVDFFYIKNREIIIEDDLYGSTLDWLLNILFDLIQAGYIEKVEE